MNLSELVDPELVFTGVESGSHPALLRAISERVAAAGDVASADDLYRKLAEREEMGSTAIGEGVAIPHCKLSPLQHVILAVADATEGLEIAAPDDLPVRTFFVLISPEEDPAGHLKGLAAISKWVKSAGNLERLRKVTSKEDLVDCLRVDSDNGQ